RNGSGKVGQRGSANRTESTSRAAAAPEKSAASNAASAFSRGPARSGARGPFHVSSSRATWDGTSRRRALRSGATAVGGGGGGVDSGGRLGAPGIRFQRGVQRNASNSFVTSGYFEWTALRML